MAVNNEQIFDIFNVEEKQKTERRSAVKIIKIPLLGAVVVLLSFVAYSAPKSSGGSSKPSSSSGGYSKPSSSSSGGASSRPSASKLYNYSSGSSGGGSQKSGSGSLGSSSGSGSASAKVTKPSPNLNPSLNQNKGKDTSVTSSGGYSKPSPVTETTAPQTAFAKGNRFDQGVTTKLREEKSAQAFNAYQEERSKFQTPPKAAPESRAPSAQAKVVSKPSPAFASTKVYSRVSYDDVYERRRTWYRGWQPPVVVYQSSPTFGSWDSTFLWWTLYHDSAFGYHHYSDPGYQAWRAEADRLAEQNADLRAQLAVHDAKIAALRTQAVATNVAYMPSEVTEQPIVAMSDEVQQQLPVQRPLLRIAAGIEGGKYYQIAQKLRAKTPKNFDVELVKTSGAEENWQLMAEGEVDAALMQSDTDYVKRRLLSKAGTSSLSLPAVHTATVYSEYVMLVVDKNSPITSVKDLRSNNRSVYVGPRGSGAALTWANFVLEDDKYGSVKVRNVDYFTALGNIHRDHQAAVMLIIGANSSLMDQIANSGDYKLITVEDYDFSHAENDHGVKVYDTLLLTEDAYPGLKQDALLKTLSVDAVWSLSDKWIKQYGESAFDEVNYATMGVISDLHIDSLVAHHGTELKRKLLWGMLVIAIVLFVAWFILNVNVTKGRGY